LISHKEHKIAAAEIKDFLVELANILRPEFDKVWKNFKSLGRGVLFLFSQIIKYSRDKYIEYA